MHALQREAFKDWFRESQTKAAQPPHTDSKIGWEAAESVDLIFAPGGMVLIRPELERLDLAFSADEKLQIGWGGAASSHPVPIRAGPAGAAGLAGTGRVVAD